MENVCSKCQKQFNEEDQVILDIFSKVTHETATRTTKVLLLQLEVTKKS